MLHQYRRQDWRYWQVHPSQADLVLLIGRFPFAEGWLLAIGILAPFLAKGPEEKTGTNAAPTR
jgi:hypothetical protein